MLPALGGHRAKINVQSMSTALQELAATATSRLDQLQTAGENSATVRDSEGTVDSKIVDEALVLGGVCGALAGGANELLATVSPSKGSSEVLKQVGATSVDGWLLRAVSRERRSDSNSVTFLRTRYG